MKTAITGLTERERFCRVYDFEPADRPPRWEAVAFWQQAVDEWRVAGGVPADVKNGADAARHFGIESWPYISGGLGFTSMALAGPRVQWRNVHQDAISRTAESDLGELVRHRTDGGTSMPQFLRFAVQSRTDWETKLKPRLRPDTHAYGNLDAEVAAARARGPVPVGLMLVGLYAFWRNFWGEENLAYAFHDCPDVLHDMARTWLTMHVECTPRVLAAWPQFDWVMFHEDMACKGGPLIGPRLFREFMAPYYRALVATLRARGLHRLAIDSDGNNGPVLECFVEVGANGLYPFEVAAGSDVFGFRARHPRFWVFGALDKRVLLGPRDGIRREVLEKVPRLWAGGGYVPSIDHAIPPCPCENFAYFLELVRGCF